MEDLNKIIADLAKSKKLDMGQRWMPEELDIFLNYFRESELEKLDEMQQVLSAQGFERSKIHLLSLYQKNKNFLTFNKQATGEILAAIMADYYDNLETQQLQLPSHKEETKRLIQSKQQQQIQQSSTALLQGNFQQPATQSQFDGSQQTSKQSQGEPIPRQNGGQTISSSRKKQSNKNGENENKGNNQQMAGMPQYEGPIFHTGGSQNIFSQFGGISTIKQQINKRKPKLPRGRFLFNQPETAEQRFALIEEKTRSCTGKNPKRTTKKGENINDQINERSLQWMEHEFFYCTIDKAYYAANTFADVLQEFGIQKNTKLKRIEWQALRSCMKGPTKFSPTFVKLELTKLGIYRKKVREYLHSQTSEKASLHDIFNDKLIEEVDKITPLRVSQLVLGIHPNCNHFHLGTVLTTNGDVVIVKFTTNDLGVTRIPDTRLSIELAQPLRIQPEEPPQQDAKQLSNQRINHASLNGESKSGAASALLQDLDYFSMAFLIKLLDRKTLLINELKEYNDQAEANENQQNKESFFQKYGWTGIQINLIDNALKHVIAKFRLRGLNHFSQQQVAENFGKILQVPLSYIERELEENPNNEGVLNEIKNISNKATEEKIQQSVNGMITKGEQRLLRERGQDYRKHVEANYYQAGYGNLMHIVFNCVGILQTLKNQGDINVTQNTFLNNLASSIYDENSEQLFEINDAIQDILYNHKTKQNPSMNQAASNLAQQQQLLSSATPATPVAAAQPVLQSQQQTQIFQQQQEQTAEKMDIQQEVPIQVDCSENNNLVAENTAQPVE